MARQNGKHADLLVGLSGTIGVYRVDDDDASSGLTVTLGGVTLRKAHSGRSHALEVSTLAPGRRCLAPSSMAIFASLFRQ